MTAAPALEFVRVHPGLAEPLADLFAALREAGDERNFHPHPLDLDAARRIGSYAGKDLYYAACQDGEVLGYGMLRGWDEGYEVPSLGIAIRPGQQGRGLGRAFMHFLHAAARARRAPAIRLKVYPDNLTARTLYEDLGYRFESAEEGQLVGRLELARR